MVLRCRWSLRLFHLGAPNRCRNETADFCCDMCEHRGPHFPTASNRQEGPETLHAGHACGVAQGFHPTHVKGGPNVRTAVFRIRGPHSGLCFICSNINFVSCKIQNGQALKSRRSAIARRRMHSCVKELSQQPVKNRCKQLNHRDFPVEFGVPGKTK